MISVNVKFDRTSEEKLLKLLDPKRYRWAIKDALTRTIGNTTTFGQKKVAKVMGVQYSDILKRGKYKGKGTKFGGVATGKRPNMRRLEGEVVGTGKPFNTVRWNGAGDGAGGVTHSAWGRPQHNPKAFQLNVNTRYGKPHLLREKSGKVRGLFGPGVTHVMEYDEVATAMSKFASRRFRHHWPSRLKYAFSVKDLPGGKRR